MPAAAIIGAGVLGAGASIYGANKQASAAKQAAQMQADQAAQTRADLMPYNVSGQNALAGLNDIAANGFNFEPTEAWLQQTPGYRFALSQGLKATQSGAAARGLGASGAAEKGAAAYATGLADQTFQNQFNNALQQFQTNYNALSGIASLGESAAAGSGTIGAQLIGNAGNALMNAGTAQAAGATGAANALGNNALTYALYNSGAFGGA